MEFVKDIFLFRYLGDMIMNMPSKTKYLVDSIALPFEPTMKDILHACEIFRSRFGDQGDTDKFNASISIEDRNNINDDCSDSYLVFSRLEKNEHYEDEMIAWHAENARLAQIQKEMSVMNHLQSVGKEARKAWKDLQRQERITRQVLGCHTMAHLM